MPEVPMQYQLFVWRKYWNATYQQMKETPSSVIFQDLQMIALESKHSPKDSK